MTKLKVEPDYSLTALLATIKIALEPREPEGPRSDAIDDSIADAVVQCGLLSWGRKDGGKEREQIPQLAWLIGEFDRRIGKLVYRHPDSPMPEEYVDIWFNRANLERWLQTRCAQNRRPRR